MLTLGLAPGTFLRTAIPLERSTDLRITPVAVDNADRWPADLVIEGAWELESSDPMFGGYSALLHLGEGRAIAFSDRGDSLTFTLPGYGDPAPLQREVAENNSVEESQDDIESAARDETTGTIWLGYERANAIGRFRNGAEARPQVVQPDAMRDWPETGGPESLARLSDGRFMGLAERGGAGVLFMGDPFDDTRSHTFTAIYPPDYRPTDAVQLPDGSILILARSVEMTFPPFRARLMIADVPDPRAAKPWTPQTVAQLDGPLPHENYEALAIQREGNSTIIWIMSDDNRSTFQRTLLVKLRWQPATD